MLLLPLLAVAQQQPKVGLVLSGGGAKGFAHVGVLEEIEKAGIQIDYIAGTSMGAIIGGLYASGYSASQIKEIILETDFSTLLQDIHPRRSKPFFEKEHGEKHVVVLPVNNKKIGLPKAISKGQNVLMFLTSALAHVDTIQDFSKLPIPFFCIATDLENGKQVKLDKGSLPLALRASGSFPTLLEPIEVNGKLLVDGGIANNFPVDEMKKMGVDIIIGVDVQSKLFNKDKINSVVDVLNQISSYSIYKNNPQKIALTDVHIHPDIYDFTVVSFNDSKKILEIGKKKAQEFSKVFDSISKLQTNKIKRKPVVKNRKPFLLDKIEISGNVNHTRAYILGKLKLQEGDFINYADINKRISYLSATDNFQQINYQLDHTEKGKKLKLDVKESTLNKTVKLGVHYDLVYKSGVLINYNHKKLFSKNDVLSLDLIVGDKPRYNLEYFIDNGFYYSVGLSSRYNSFRSNANSNTTGINKVDLQYTDFTNSIYIQTTFDRKFALGLGVEFQSILSKTETIATPSGAPFVFDNSNYFNVFSYLKLDTYDDKYYPTKGVFFDGQFKWFASSSDFNKDFVQFSQVKGKLGFAKALNNKFTFQYVSEAGFTLGKVTSKTFDFLLGGYNENFINNFIPFYGYDINELSEQTYLKSTFHLRYNFKKNQYLHFIANYARVDDSVLNGAELFNDTKSGYAVGYSYNLPFIGPIDLKYSWSPDTKKNYWYFNLGFWF